MSEYIIRANDLRKVLAEEYGEESPIVTAWLPHYLEKIPTIDAVPVVHSRWSKKIWGAKKECPRCKAPMPYTKVKSGYCVLWKSNYCPNCGAKMDENEKESEQ